MSWKSGLNKIAALESKQIKKKSNPNSLPATINNLIFKLFHQAFKVNWINAILK